MAGTPAVCGHPQRCRWRTEPLIVSRVFVSAPAHFRPTCTDNQSATLWRQAAGGSWQQGVGCQPDGRRPRARRRLAVHESEMTPSWPSFGISCRPSCVARATICIDTIDRADSSIRLRMPQESRPGWVVLLPRPPPPHFVHYGTREVQECTALELRGTIC